MFVVCFRVCVDQRDLEIRVQLGIILKAQLAPID